MKPSGAVDGLLTRPSTATVRSSAGRPARPIGNAAFLGVCVVSFGGPLALAALYAPTIVEDVPGSAGLVAVAAAVAFGVPLAVWLRYARHIAGNGGLYGFVREAAGTRVAAAQATLWIASYALYLTYTTASIVYDTLPTVLPGVRPYRSLLEIAIPVALAGVMLAGRSATLAVLGTMAVGQLVLVGSLAAVTIGHDAPVSSFALRAPSADLGTATGQVALLYVCGSLPLFVGGEVARPVRTIRTGLLGGFALTVVGVAAVVFPLAQNPAFTRAPIPGMSIAEVFAGHGLAVAIGVGVAVSIAGVMLVEFLALSRLVSVVARQPVRKVVVAMSAALVLSAPITLIAPERIYEDLLKPSLAALWLSQLIVFAAYPRFAARLGRLGPGSVVLAVGGVLFTVYGLYASLQHSST